MTMAEHHIPAFGDAVKAVLEAHGLSLRSQRIRTGIDHMTMKDMADGLRPRLEKVEQFARAFGLDVNEWRRIAGYEPIPPPADVGILAKAIISTHQAQTASLELEYEPDLENVRIVGYEGRVTPEDRELALKVLRAVLAESRRKQDT